jgi:acetylglutamate kinase
VIDPNELGPLPGGFRFAGVHAGIKRSRPDLAVIACIPGTTAAGCFTKNPVRAACVDRDAALLPGSDVRALVVNSGNANAMTGAAGVEANDAMAAAVAEALGVAPAAVLSCSTGVIGVPLFVPTIARAVPRLCQRLADDAAAVADFADAILTTDTTRKLAAATVERPGSPIPIRIVGVAKGSGMIHPDMATTLGFVCTDARVSPALLARLLSSGVDDTFNAISVDGDTSTNDAVIALASGASGHLVESVDEVEAFAAAFHRVLDELARMVAADGEGATRLLSVTVQGAPDRAAARVLARGICTGSLFKCSVFAGEPAGWGRACAALGQAALEHGVPLDPAALAVSAQGIAVVAGGAGIENVPLGELSRRLREPQVAWTVRVGDGPGRFTAHGCDLSYDYVRINADEALQVEVRPDGAVGRNLSLSSYTPTLKHQLIFDALDYVHRFAGMRLVIGASGAVVEKPELLASLARDLELLAAAGLRPLVVVGAAATAQALVEHFEQSPHRLALVPPDPAAIARKLDRAHPCVLVQTRPDPGELVALAIRLGAGKLLALADDQGLHDETGLCAQLGPEQAIAGLDRGRFSTGADEFLALARHAARQGLPALHLVDGRVPHALVAELFTEQGVGTLVTRQALVNGSHS